LLNNHLQRLLYYERKEGGAGWARGGVGGGGGGVNRGRVRWLTRQPQVGARRYEQATDRRREGAPTRLNEAMSEPPRRLFRRSAPTLQEQRRRAELAAAGCYGHDENVHPTTNPTATPPKRPLQSSPSSRHAISPSLSEACHGAASPSLSDVCHGAASPSLSEMCHGAASPSLSDVCRGAASPSLSEACHGAASPLPFCASKRPSPPSFGASTRLSQQRTRVIEYEEEATPAPDASHESGDRSSADRGQRTRAAVAAAQLEDPRAALQRGQSAPLAAPEPELGSCASSGRAWQLWLAG